MNIESSKHRFEEITMPTAESPILLQKINAQIIEFNQQGSLVAIGCKYGIVLIFDILSKEIVRYFNIYLDAELPDAQADARSFELNIDSDQFIPYRKMNLAYNDDDFEYQQRPKKQELAQNMANQSAAQSDKNANSVYNQGQVFNQSSFG
jgi:hypothetical protein